MRIDLRLKRAQLGLTDQPAHLLPAQRFDSLRDFDSGSAECVEVLAEVALPSFAASEQDALHVALATPDGHDDFRPVPLRRRMGRWKQVGEDRTMQAGPTFQLALRDDRIVLGFHSGGDERRAPVDILIFAGEDRAVFYAARQAGDAAPPEDCLGEPSLDSIPQP